MSGEASSEETDFRRVTSKNRQFLQKSGINWSRVGLG